MTRFFLAIIFVSIFFNHLFAGCSDFDGADIIANDGKYLGKIASEFVYDSIFNEFGTYGSEFSGLSIWNEFGQYGSQFSALSPFNRFSTTPPVIIKNNNIIGYLTVNEFTNGVVNPIILGEVCYGVERR